MSATNWAVCPFCVSKAEKNIRKRKEELSEWYGNMPEEDYLKEKKKIPNRVNPEKYRTLREDYEIYMDSDGTFMVYYRGRCDECDNEFNFNKNEEQAFPVL